MARGTTVGGSSARYCLRVASSNFSNMLAKAEGVGIMDVSCEDKMKLKRKYVFDRCAARSPSSDGSAISVRKWGCVKLVPCIWTFWLASLIQEHPRIRQSIVSCDFGLTKSNASYFGLSRSTLLPCQHRAQRSWGILDRKQHQSLVLLLLRNGQAPFSKHTRMLNRTANGLPMPWAHPNRSTPTMYEDIHSAMNQHEYRAQQ